MHPLRRFSTYVHPVRRFSNTLIVDHTAPHIYRETMLRISTMACGFLSDHRCELWVLFILSRAKLALSVNSMNGINQRLAITQWQKSNRLASPPSSRRCTICRWKGYRPCWRKVRHTVVCGTPIRIEILRVLGGGLCSTNWRMLSASSTFCSFARSEEIWLLGSAPVSHSLL